MTLPDDVVHAALHAYTRFCAAETVQRGRVLDKDADYKPANVEYVRARQAFGLAMETVKAAVAREEVRLAAEAGSPAAKMLTPSAR